MTDPDLQKGKGGDQAVDKVRYRYLGARFRLRLASACSATDEMRCWSLLQVIHLLTEARGCSTAFYRGTRKYTYLPLRSAPGVIMRTQLCTYKHVCNI